MLLPLQALRFLRVPLISGFFVETFSSSGVASTADEEKVLTNNPRNKRDARETKILKRKQQKETLRSFNLGFGLKIPVKNGTARKEAMQRRDTEKMAVREETALKGRKKRRGKSTADVKAEKEVES